LCKMLRGIAIWTSEGERRATINRGRAVESVTWLPHGEAFISVEGADVRKLDLEGKILDEYPFIRHTIHDVAITKDSTRMICVASSSSQVDSELGDALHRKQEMIMVYNLLNKKIESRVPVLGESRNVKLAGDGETVLVSYENKTPPQRWKIEVRKIKADDGSVTDELAFLSLEQTYMPKRPVDFAGPSHFGGRHDELVVCAGKNGMIFVWDSRTGFLLHHFPTQDIDGDLTCLTWNHASEKFMFGAGRNNGTVRIWTPMPRFNRPPGVGTSIDTPRSSSPLPTSLRGRADRRAGPGTWVTGIGRDHSRDATTIEEELDPRNLVPSDIYLALSG